MRARIHTLGGSQVVVRMFLDQARGVLDELERMETEGSYAYGPLADLRFVLREVTER